VAPSIVLRFHWHHITWGSASCSLYNQKLFNVIDAFNCYKQKWKVATFNLAHLVDVLACSLSATDAGVRG